MTSLAIAPSRPSVTFPRADAARPQIDLSKLPGGAMFMRILGVNYVRLRTADEGDIYLTEHGVAFWMHLQPQNWYEKAWFEGHRTRLEGTGTVYRVPTRPIEEERPKSIDLVVKWSRVGEDVPLNTFTLQRAINAEFNTPFEEFSLLEDLRRGEYGPKSLRIRTQKPLAIYIPPERMQLWQTGRSKAKLLSKIGRHPAVEIDILRSYIMLYGWIKGFDAVSAENHIAASRTQAEQELREFTLAADTQLRAKGFMVADHKPTHLIVRMRDGKMRRRRDGRNLYAIVDYELLSRTPAYDHVVSTARRSEYFFRQRDRFLPRDLSTYPSHLKPAKVLGVDYVYGATESTNGQLWVVGNDPELVNYFLPERWRQKQVLMSPTNETYYVQTKDRIHLLWKVSNVGEMPAVDEEDPGFEAMMRQGFHCPFEEFAMAIEMSRAGVPTVHPRAIYATGKYGGVPGCVSDGRRFERMANVLSPDGKCVLPPDQDYITLWGYWRGLDDVQGCTDIVRWAPMDAAQACRAGMIGAKELDAMIQRQRRTLAVAGFEDVNLRGEHLLLSYVPEGSFKTDDRGEIELRQCNFEFVRRL